MSLSLWLLAASVALADIPQDPGDCVIENYDADECEVCGETTFDTDDTCGGKLGATHELVCSTGGASFQDQIWCTPGHTDKVDAGKGGCAVVPGAGGAMGLALLALLAGRRRR